MKRINRTVFALFLMAFTACATTGSGTGLFLMDAIEQTGEKIAGELPKGSRVAIVAFESMNDNLSDYIMEELTGALFDRGIEVADRQNLEYVYKELDFQMGGDVSDESAKSIGKFLAADMVITGQLLDLEGMYRYRTSAINVETAVRASVTRLDVRSDKAARRMVTALANQKTTVKTAKYGMSADVRPQTAGTFLDRGIVFARQYDNENAIADFTEAIRLDPNMEAAYWNRAIMYSRKGEYDRAIADFTQVIRLDPNNSKTHFYRGSLYQEKGNDDLAIADFTKALMIDPSAVVLYARGISYFNKGDIDRAIADFNEAIQEVPNIPKWYKNRAWAYGRKGDFDRAITDYSQAIRLDPNDAEAYDRRSRMYVEIGDLGRAIGDLRQMIRLNPNNADAYFRRGLVYAMMGDLDLAINDLETVLRIAPNHSNARQALQMMRQMQDR